MAARGVSTRQDTRSRRPLGLGAPEPGPQRPEARPISRVSPAPQLHRGANKGETNQRVIGRKRRGEKGLSAGATNPNRSMPTIQAAQYARSDSHHRHTPPLGGDSRRAQGSKVTTANATATNPDQHRRSQARAGGLRFFVGRGEWSKATAFRRKTGGRERLTNSCPNLHIIPITRMADVPASGSFA